MVQGRKSRGRNRGDLANELPRRRRIAVSAGLIAAATSAATPGARPSTRASRRRQGGETSHSKMIIDACKPFAWKDQDSPTSALTQDETRVIEAKWLAALRP
jgi:hypothetical protein